MKSAAEIGAATLARLAAQATANREAGAALRAEIRAVMEAHVGPDRLTAKRVLEKLSRRPLPSVRRVQEHMRAIDAESSAPRFTLTHTATHDVSGTARSHATAGVLTG